MTALKTAITFVLGISVLGFGLVQISQPAYAVANCAYVSSCNTRCYCPDTGTIMYAGECEDSDCNDIE